MKLTKALINKLKETKEKKVILTNKYLHNGDIAFIKDIIELSDKDFGLIINDNESADKILDSFINREDIIYTKDFKTNDFNYIVKRDFKYIKPRDIKFYSTGDGFFKGYKNEEIHFCIADRYLSILKQLNKEYKNLIIQFNVFEERYKDSIPFPFGFYKFICNDKILGFYAAARIKVNITDKNSYWVLEHSETKETIVIGEHFTEKDYA